jgi:type I restriction enzyme M protein
MVSLGDERYFQICSGGTPSSANPEYWGGKVNWITLADLPTENFITNIENTERTITEAGVSNSNAKLLPINTVVVSTRATIGRVGIARTELATNQGFKNIIVKNPSEVLPIYVAYIIRAKKNEMISLASGATFKEISKENFCSIQIRFPN